MSAHALTRFWAIAIPLLAAVHPLRAQDTIRAVRIETRPVFDSADANSWFFHTLNLLHVTTRQFVVEEELTVHPGSPYDSAALAESTRNLRALGIFRDVAIDTVDSAGSLVVRVDTHDAWTTNPTIHLQTSGTEATVGGGISERNFLGTNTLLSGEYTRNPDRSVLALEAAHPRLIARTVGVDVTFQGRSDGTIVEPTLSAPFFSLTTPAGGSLAGQAIDARVLQFVGGDPTPAREVRQRSDALVADGAAKISASDAGYLRVGLTGQLRWDGFRPESATGPFPRSLAAAIGPYVEYRRVHYLTTRGYEAYGRDEDVDLGLTARVGVAAGGGIGPSASITAGTRIPRGFVLANASADGKFTSAGLDSGAVIGGVTAVFQGGTRHLGVIHADGGLRSRPYPGEEFDLGLGYGARAYPIHAFTGDRTYITSAEYRYIVVPDALGLEAVGVAAFVDHAGAWYAGSPVRSGTDVGVGLRFGALRSPTGGMIRIDLAYRAATDVDRAQWVLAVGKGFAFNVR